MKVFTNSNLKKLDSVVGFIEGHSMLKASIPGVITVSLFISLSVSAIEWNQCEISILCHALRKRKASYFQIFTRPSIRTTDNGACLILIIPATLEILVLIPD